MSDDLRRRVVRLAFLREDLRPHLLPLVGVEKLGFVRLPRDATSFGFAGPDAARKGLILAASVRDAVDLVKAQVAVVWHNVKKDIQDCQNVDAQPLVSRNFVGLAMQDVLQDLSKMAVPYFERGAR